MVRLTALGVEACRCWPRLSDDGDRPDEFAVRRAAGADAVPALRRMVRAWVAATSLDEERAEGVVLAVDEAVTNAVEHAYSEPATVAGEVEVVASPRVCGGGVAICVVDRGRWRPIPADPGHRGRGLMLIRSIADRASIEHTEDGTTVRMCWTTCASDQEASVSTDADGGTRSD